MKRPKNFKLAPGVKRHSSIFDRDGANISFPTPNGVDLIILAGNRGGGYIPFTTLLPHQVYQTKLEKYFDEERWQSIFAIPVRSDEPILLAAHNEQSLHFWQAPRPIMTDRKRTGIRYPLTKKFKKNVEMLANGQYDEVDAPRLVEDFMRSHEQLVQAEIRKAIEKRDEQWDVKLKNMRWSL